VPATVSLHARLSAAAAGVGAVVATAVTAERRERRARVGRPMVRATGVVRTGRGGEGDA